MPTSREYWQSRSEAILLMNEMSALQYEEELKRSYQAAIRQITKEVDAFYGRYASDNNIDLTEARRRLKPNELMDFQANVTNYMQEVERLGDNAFTEEYKAYLKGLSGRAYISRIESLIANIRHNIETLAIGYNDGLGQVLEYAYEDAFYRTVFHAQSQAKLGVQFNAPGAKQLEKAVRERWLGRNYSDSIWQDKSRLILQLDQMISQEFVRGRGSRVLAKELAHKLDVSYANAQRLIRTEINYISNKGTMQAYRDSGVVERYEYVATLDNRTSKICSEMDGKVFALNEAKVGVNLPPLHPYCRSTTIPYFEDDDISDYITNRVARNKGGKTYKLGKDVTFEQWVNNYAEASYARRVSNNNV